MSLNNHVVVGISSSALFDTRDENALFKEEGTKAFVRIQLEREDLPFLRGPAFPFVKAIFKLNELSTLAKKIEVVILSHNEPEAGLRIMNSVDHYKLPITRAAFTGGTNVASYLSAFNVNLFLSRHEADVIKATKCGIPSGLIYDCAEDISAKDEPLKIAFDGDSVLFSGESDEIWNKEGEEAFYENERANANLPLNDGPITPFLRLIHEIQEASNKEVIPPIRTALITARNSPAHKRVILTLRAWNIKINEMFFMGDQPKTEILRSFKPHIFFDDKSHHVTAASKYVPAARVPYVESSGQIEHNHSVANAVETKSNFASETRRIFLQYKSQKGNRLHQDYRDFISRNSVRTPNERAAILKNLRKYDLSTDGNFKPYFNRERGDSLRKKLSEIVSL